MSTIQTMKYFDFAEKEKTIIANEEDYGNN